MLLEYVLFELGRWAFAIGLVGGIVLIVGRGWSKKRAMQEMLRQLNESGIEVNRMKRTKIKD